MGSLLKMQRLKFKTHADHSRSEKVMAWSARKKKSSFTKIKKPVLVGWEDSITRSLSENNDLKQSPLRSLTIKRVA